MQHLEDAPVVLAFAFDGLCLHLMDETFVLRVYLFNLISNTLNLVSL